MEDGIDRFFLRAFSMITMALGIPCAFVVSGKLYLLGEAQMSLIVFVVGIATMILLFYLLLSGRWFEEFE